MESKKSLRPTESRKIHVSYQNLSDLLFKKDHIVNLNMLPINQRLSSIYKFRSVYESLKRKPLHHVITRAKQLMEDATFEKVKIKAQQQLKELGGSNSEASSPRKVAKSRSKKKNVLTKTPSNRISVSTELNKDKDSLEARIHEISKTNKLVRNFVRVVTNKENLFYLEFTQEYLSYLILAFFELFNLNKIPHAILIRATEDANFFDLK